MRPFSLLSIFVTLAFSAVYGDSSAEHSEVIDLKTSDFKSLVEKEHLVLIEFSGCFRSASVPYLSQSLHDIISSL